MATGWWLLAGREGRPSPMARVASRSDVEIHEATGWFLALLALVGIIVGFRAAITLVVDSLRYRRSDLGWLAVWPRAVLTGRFGRHDGHFDPGQRVANVVIVLSLGALVASGFGLIAVSGGSAFVWFLRIHKWATYVLTPVVAGHVLIGLGILPGYRGVWPAMHRPGHMSQATARRLWPAWVEARTRPPAD
jgi:cytochrome b subunit of formate dehydrogenase